MGMLAICFPSFVAYVASCTALYTISDMPSHDALSSCVDCGTRVARSASQHYIVVLCFAKDVL
jgi:hypothetical protein